MKSRLRLRSETRIGNWFMRVIERGAFDGCELRRLLFRPHETMEYPWPSRRHNANFDAALSPVASLSSGRS